MIIVKKLDFWKLEETTHFNAITTEEHVVKAVLHLGTTWVISQ